MIEETINGYASAKSTDPGFLKYLRMGRTMIGKALTMRGDALDPSAKEEFYKQTGRLEFICVPRSEAKKEYAQLLAMQSTIPMETKDFEDWYCSVIETTCKKCCTEQYTECQIRGILTKYGVYPIDPTAVGKCQFSYVGTPEAEELQLVEDTKTVPADVYNAALAAVKAKEASINENYVPLIKRLQAEINTTKSQLVDILYLEDDRPENASIEELIACVKESFQNCDAQEHEQLEKIRSLRAQIDAAESKLTAVSEEKNEVKHIANTALNDVLRLTKERDEFREQFQAAAATREQPKEEYPVNIGLASGGEFDYVLPAHMAEIMIHEIQRPRHSRGTCAQYVGGSLVAIDLQEVVALHVDKLPPKDWVKPKEVQAVPGQQEKYRVECKCGAEYYAEMNAGRTKAWCRECKTTVFADRSAEVSTADGAAATLLTNRYWVEREQPAERRKEIPTPEISNNFGKEYKDPINPLA